MKTFTTFLLKESILDPQRPTLDPSIFTGLDSEPTVRPEVRTKILAGISKLMKHVDVVDYTIIGSILTRQYNQTSDIDVNILVSATENEMEELRKLAITYSGEIIFGTKHPIQYHVLNSKDDFDNANASAEAVFNLNKNRYIRKPTEKPFHVEKYMEKFKRAVKDIEDLKGDLQDDLMDYSELKRLSKAEVEDLCKLIEKELSDIESSALGLVDLYKKVTKERADSFKKPLTAKDIREYGTKTRLPGNVVYKLLERHYYIQFLEKVKQIMADGKVTPKEADKLNTLVNKN
jgi:predicted nucleotidyltransferase